MKSSLYTTEPRISVTDGTPKIAGSTFTVVATGRSASFTRWDTPAECDTYRILTVPAADGILSSVYWKPGISYQILAIGIINPIRVIRRTHRESRIMAPDSGMSMSESYTMRSRAVLVDPAYTITARMLFPSSSISRNEMMRHDAVLRRRILRGGAYEQPFFGIREYVCHIKEADGNERTQCISEDFGPLPFRLERVADSRGPVVLTRHTFDPLEARWVRSEYRGSVRAHYMPGHIQDGILRVAPSLYDDVS